MNLSPALLKFVEHLNTKGNKIKLKYRFSFDSWVYDGDSISTYEDYKKPYTDHDILHEIGHYVAAHPDQLLFPEYGLQLGVVDFYAFGPIASEFRDKTGKLIWENIKPVQNGLINFEEQQKQEQVAWLFGIHYGPILNLKANTKDYENYTWETAVLETEQAKTEGWYYDEIYYRFNLIRQTIE